MPAPTFRVPRSISACYSIDDLRRLAQQRLPRSIFDFYAGGAEDESTLEANRAAFSRHGLAPRVLVDVRAASPASTLFGKPMGMPMAIGPTGALGFGWRDADLHLARAAQKHGIPFTLSSSGTVSIETLAKEAPGRLWFQAYVLRNSSGAAPMWPRRSRWAPVAYCWAVPLCSASLPAARTVP